MMYKHGNYIKDRIPSTCKYFLAKMSQNNTLAKISALTDNFPDEITAYYAESLTDCTNVLLKNSLFTYLQALGITCYETTLHIFFLQTSKDNCPLIRITTRQFYSCCTVVLLTLRNPVNLQIDFFLQV